ncbi:MAG: hypothetical protein M3282_03695 [Gemmatimonadota bacterium]|nr:hypothetical protein [Gemmatimonadota bacterium]
MSARTLLSLALIVTAGCAGKSPLDTTDQSALAREARAVGPGGLEQRLTVTVDPEDFREPGFHTLAVTSDVINTGSSSVPITARVCLFFDSDVQISAEADRFEPLISCGAVQQTTQLAPGASVGPMELRYRIRSGPGVYTIRVRHALNPEFRAEASFRIP